MDDMKDIDFGAMHRDAVGSLEALETLLANTRKLAAFSGQYLSQGEVEELTEEEEEMADAEKDDSDLTNTVDRTPKEERKKLAIIKLSRMR